MRSRISNARHSAHLVRGTERECGTLCRGQQEFDTPLLLKRAFHRERGFQLTQHQLTKTREVGLGLRARLEIAAVEVIQEPLHALGVQTLLRPEMQLEERDRR